MSRCWRRDSRLKELLIEWGILDTDQIRLLLYKSERVTRRHLTRLYREGIIKRSTQTVPYSYFVDKQKEPLKRLGTNWARLWLRHRRKSWERLEFDYLTNTAILTNTATGAVKELHLVEKEFRLPGDSIIVLSDESINRMRSEVLCGKPC